MRMCYQEHSQPNWAVSSNSNNFPFIEIPSLESSPKQFENLSQLSVLDLSRNFLSGTIPSYFQALTRLSSLDLGQNLLSGTISTQLGSPSNLLQRLDLGQNSLSGTIPTELGLWKGLETLILTQNNLSGTIPPEIRNLTALAEFDVRVNQLGGSPSLSYPQSLDTLYLAFNRFEGTFSISDHPLLRVFDISMNNITAIALEGNPKLKKIEAQFNQISEAKITNNPSLAVVDLQSNLLQEIPDFIRDTGEPLQPLSTVVLAFNQISGTVPDYLFNPNLMILDLSRNSLSGSDATIRFFSPPALIPTKKDDCYLKSKLIQDPDRRLIILVGNKMNQSFLSIEEIGNIKQRFPSICNQTIGIRDDSRVVRTGAYPQGCGQHGEYLSPEMKCQSCYLDWQTEERRDIQGWASTLDTLKLSPDDSFHYETYLTCSHCTGGIRKRTRALAAKRECEGLGLLPDEKELSCAFPCKMDNVNPRDSFRRLLEELKRNLGEPNNSTTFLPLLVNRLFSGVLISIPKASERVSWNFFIDWFYRVDQVVFGVQGCKNLIQYKNISSAILTVCQAIEPKIAFQVVTDDVAMNQVTLTVSQLETNLLIIVGTVVGLLITVPIFILFIWIFSTVLRYLLSDVRSLPDEMAWSYLQHLRKPWNSEKEGSDRAWFHHRKFEKDSKEWKRVMKLFQKFLGGSDIKIESIISVYNPNLITSFVSAWNTRDSRKNHKLFTVPMGEEEDSFRQRQEVSNCFKKKSFHDDVE